MKHPVANVNCSWLIVPPGDIETNSYPFRRTVTSMNFKTITSMYKKDLNDPDTHDGVITHLQPGILESEVKWALGASLRTKLVEVMESQLSYFFFFFSSWAISSPKRWCCESAVRNIPANLAVASGLEKVSFHSNPKERKCQRMLKLPHNCIHLTC